LFELDGTPVTLLDAVPEPGAWLLAGIGLIGLWIFRRLMNGVSEALLVRGIGIGSDSSGNGQNQFVRLCCKNGSDGKPEPIAQSAWHRLAFPSEDFPDELNLPGHIPFRQPSHLAFPDHVQNLVALNRSPRPIGISLFSVGGTAV
jgi:hypothetical protein